MRQSIRVTPNSKAEASFAFFLTLTRGFTINKTTLISREQIVQTQENRSDSQMGPQGLTAFVARKTLTGVHTRRKRQILTTSYAISHSAMVQPNALRTGANSREKVLRVRKHPRYIMSCL